MVLPKIMYPLQSAFVANRDTYDNILITYDNLTTFSKNCSKGGYIAIKLYLENVYDSLEWNFIKKCLMILVFVKN